MLLNRSLTISKFIIGSAAGFVLAAYLMLPTPALRAFSGPPPVFSFDTAVGTGFFIGDDIVTNAHVVSACRRITISGYGFKAVPADLIAADAGKDLALLHADITPPATIQFGYDASSPTRARIVGYRGFGTAQKTSPLEISTLDNQHGNRIIHGLFGQGQSGSPILYNDGHAAGMMSAITLINHDPSTWLKDTVDGWTGNTGEMIPGNAVEGFVWSFGGILAGSTGLPERAVVHIFCFSTWP